MTHNFLLKCIAKFLAFLIFSINFSPLIVFAESKLNKADNSIDKFLNSSEQLELITLAQSLGYLPEIPKTAFGSLEYTTESIWLKKTIRLGAWDQYGDVKSNSNNSKPLRPKTFNEIPAVLVISAINKGILDKSLISSAKIKKELLWESSHWVTYIFKNKNEVDYASIVKWIAKKQKIKNIESKTISELENEITENRMREMFSNVWDKMSKDQKVDFLNKIEKEHNIKINNKAGITTATAGVAWVALCSAVNMGGFSSYTLMTTTLCLASKWAITIPFAYYAMLTKGLAIATGPFGWAIAGTLIVSSSFFFGTANIENTTNFIMTKHIIELSKEK